MEEKLRFTQREITEIQHALYYSSFCNNGTVGHNLLLIVAKFAKYNGFVLNPIVGGSLSVPEIVEEIDSK